jgi:hypothetical protein
MSARPSATSCAAERLAATRPLGFVGSHPLAGSEQAGYRVARAELFRRAAVVVTPTEKTELAALKTTTELWEALGARVTSLDPETHDRTVAAISHLPHLIACALVDGAGRVEPGALELAARGFRTDAHRRRIRTCGPRSSWQNRDARAGDRGVRQALGDLQRVIDSGRADALGAELARIKAIRRAAVMPRKIRSSRSTVRPGPKEHGGSHAGRAVGYTLIPTGGMYRAPALSVMRARVPVRESAELRAHLARSRSWSRPATSTSTART